MVMMSVCCHQKCLDNTPDILSSMTRCLKVQTRTTKLSGAQDAVSVMFEDDDTEPHDNTRE